MHYYFNFILFQYYEIYYDVSSSAYFNKNSCLSSFYAVGLSFDDFFKINWRKFFNLEGKLSSNLMSSVIIFFKSVLV